MHSLKVAIPWLLLSLRVLMAPYMVLASRGIKDRTVLWLYALAFATDYFDGVTARYFGTATPLLRKSDSAADTIFHLAVAFLIVRRHPEEFSKSAVALTLYLTTVLLWCAIDAIRWHRITGFHAYTAKLFSIGLMWWIITLFSGWNTGHPLSIVLLIGTASNIEGIYISFLLKRDRTDVCTIFHAFGIKRDQSEQQPGAIQCRSSELNK